MNNILKGLIVYLKIVFNFIFNPFRIFLMNIRRNFLRQIFIGIGILISVFLLIISTTFGTGVENMAKENVYAKIPATRIKVQGRIYSNPLNKLFNRQVHTQQNLTWRFIEQNIKIIKGVKSVVPIQNVTYPISAEFQLFATVMKMDVIANGLPQSMAINYIFPEYKRIFGNRFEPRGNIVPVLVSEFVMDAFKQMTVAQNAPVSIDKNFFIPSSVNAYRGYRFKLHLGKSIFGETKENSEEYEAVVVGFADPDVSSGLSLPASLVRRTKIKFQGNYVGNTYESAFINIVNATFFNNVVNELSKLNKKYPANFNIVLDREVQKFRDISKMINETVKSFSIPVIVFSLIILFLSCLIVYFAFLYIVNKREKEIGLYRFFGSSKIKVILLLVFEAVFISAICAYYGYILAEKVILHYLPDNYEKFVTLLPQEVRTILTTFNLGSKQAFTSLFTFNNSKAFQISIYAVLASAISAFIPSLIGAWKGLLKSVNK